MDAPRHLLVKDPQQVNSRSRSNRDSFTNGVDVEVYYVDDFGLLAVQFDTFPFLCSTL